MKVRLDARLTLAAGLVIFGTILRIVPHPWNFTPVGAMSLFSGACLDRKRWAFAVPLATMFASDSLLELLTGHGYHSLMPVVYGTFALIVALGMALRARRNSPAAIAGGAVAAATIFYIVSNFAVWTISMIYPHTFAGLITCYVSALPYYETMMAADVLFSALLFGTFVWAERTFPAFAPR